MSDTNQFVLWSLEFPCEFRKGPNWQRPHETETALRTIRLSSRACVEENLLDGHVVTSSHFAGCDWNHSVPIPSAGVKLESLLEPYGGWKHVCEACQACRANAGGESGDESAGCFGMIRERYPEGIEFNRKLRWTIARLGLKEKWQHAFLATRDPWFGFWASSPLTMDQLEILLAVFSRVFPADHRDFVRAMEISTWRDIPLHVVLLPPGHTDFGTHTTFAHCPRCKFESPLPRWEDASSQRLICAMCRFEYDPLPTRRRDHDRERFERDGQSTDFRELLGDEYEAWITQYCLQRGYSAEQIEQALRSER